MNAYGAGRYGAGWHAAGRYAAGRFGDDGTGLSRELVAQNHQEIGRADGKAAVLLATSATLLGLLLARRPSGGTPALPLWWCATVMTTGALLLLLMALVPRTTVRTEGPVPVLAYYEDVLSAQAGAALCAGLGRGGADPGPRLLRALTGTSRVARAKNRCVRGAVLALLPAVTVAVPALTAG
ncbi:Pycsar system effector family protein [Streptomyces sp. NPDC005955]|uniref:Pycsar system effector family protein n=1 Tax=Streptomyces sp. NPDC005955 TaxID=3364738 RepID=UPI0036A75D49